MLQYFLFFLLSTTSVKANTGCPGNYQYERQPPASFNHCNPVRTSLQLECTVLVPSGNTAVTVDWYWSKNINECGRNITEEQGRFTTTTNRASSHLLNTDRITTDLTITSPETDTGYYWCQVDDPSYNGVFISSNKAPVFNTGTMIDCSGTQSTLQSKCAVGSTHPLICSETVALSSSQTSSKINVSPDTTYHMTTATLVTPVGVTGNTPVPSGVISNTPVSSSVISNPPVSSSVISNSPVPSDQTSNNTTTVAVVVVTVLILLATLVLVIVAVIIVIFVVKRQPHHKISLQKQPINTSKHNEDNKSYPLTDIKSNQSNKPPRPLSRPPSRPPPYSSNSQEKETEIKDTKLNKSNKPPRPPSPPPPYSSKAQKKETEIKDIPVTANSAYSSSKETKIKDKAVTTSSAGFSNELPTYAVLDWENKPKPVTKPKEQSPPKSDAIVYTTIVKNTE